MERIGENDLQQGQSGYRRILKSTFIMGGSSIFITFLGVVRTKIVAVLLGPTGIGLTGIYFTVIQLLGTVCGLGIGESGVRQIAGTCGTGDEESISRTIVCIRRMALLSGIGGGLLLLITSGTVSNFTFGDQRHAFDLALLSCSVLCGAVSSGQSALIQGMRRIEDLAKLSMLGGFFGTVFSIPIIYFWGERGIALFLLAVSAMDVATAWWYARKIKVPAVAVPWRDSFGDAKPLLSLGSALMCGTLMIMGAQYLLKVFVVRQLGLSATGVYQASTTLSFVYVGIILKAMITDFYPRLSAAAQDDKECASLINNQIEVGLLLAVPGIIGILTFAPFVIGIFYTSRFMLAVDVLRWQILGVLIQVVTWPMGFIFRAKGEGRLFFLTELFANTLHLALAWVGLTYFALPGVGMAFLGMNASYSILVFCILRGKYGFGFSTHNLKLFVIFAASIAAAFVTPYLLPKIFSLICNTCIIVCVGIFALKTLLERANVDSMPSIVGKIKARFSFLT